ncbi:MAG: 4Fe-4S dicluster domain-containing protein [Clostridia bacterium]|nr:4Fe-4S dicluster domain-containing protein [Clostridia bacterium]
MYKIKKDEIDGLFNKLGEKYDLFLPVGDSYKKYEKGDRPSERTNTVRSPKDFFFPQTENMIKFRVAGKKIAIADIRTEKEDFIIFGVRACDLKSFEVLDRVFLSDPADPYYAERRAHGVIMTEACLRPSETCFCRTFGIDPSEPGGDISVYRDDVYIYLKTNTEKGEKTLSDAADLLEKADENDIKPIKDEIKKILGRLPFKDLSTDGFGTGKTAKLFDRPEWEELSHSCLGCGTCTFVCPTCQCYDIKDYKTNNGVIRYRCWDSCMYSDFTRMSAGQPRLTQKERFRQRFMHKLVYFPDNNDGIFGCVGCGRCLQSCPVNMNTVKVMKTLGGANG